jgi:hypothetical protein
MLREKMWFELVETPGGRDEALPVFRDERERATQLNAAQGREGYGG